jgi:polar amino acid transport system substrate-binding protein
MRKTSWIIRICFAFFLLSAFPLQAQDSSPIRVGIKPITPFVDFNDDGSYSGFSIDLWNTIAQRIGRDFEYVPYETVSEVLDAVRAEQVDVGIAAISITREREETLDFSQPMFNAGLQIMTPFESNVSQLATTAQVLTSQFAPILLILVAVVILLGHLVWLAERRVNENFPKTYFAGVGEGIWWAAASVVGTNDHAPKTLIGRIGAVVWVLIGIVMISNVTAAITTANTLGQLQGSIQNVSDLPGNRVVTVEGTTAANYLTDLGLGFRTVTAIEEAYPLLETGAADAVVYDAPVLRYHAHTEGAGRVHVVGGLFARQDYGIAFATDNILREEVDRALLSLQEDGTFAAIYVQWFGADE